MNAKHKQLSSKLIACSHCCTTHKTERDCPLTNPQRSTDRAASMAALNSIKLEGL